MQAVLLVLVLANLDTTAAQDVPHSVEQTWAQFDPRLEPLEIELIRESTEDGIVLQYVRYVVGTFGGKKTRVAAFYAFPEHGERLPGIVQLHGGGQRAMPETARFWALHGYAAVAVNWGELVIGEKDDPNTDWAGIPAGFLDPKHHNDVSPGEGTIYDVPHPWNSSWLLYSAAARRAITFLEHQPEADGSKIGLTGHSMGGRLTVLTAIDLRVKAASPSVGGSGYLYSDIAGVPGSARHMQADLELYNATLDCKNYWRLIRCPLMFLGATNDFNSPMELVLRGFRSLPQKNGAMSFTPLLTITSQCRQAFPHQLVEAGVRPSGERQRLIDDFSHGWRDWSLVSANNSVHWNCETHKVNDPAFVGPHGASLAFEIETTASNNTLAVIMEVDRWRGYTGRKTRRFTALVDLSESGPHCVELPAGKFVTSEGEVLENYDFVTSLILTPGQKERPDLVTKVWQGKIPTFRNMRWEGEVGGLRGAPNALARLAGPLNRWGWGRLVQKANPGAAADRDLDSQDSLSK